MPGYLQCGYYETRYCQFNTFPHVSIFIQLAVKGFVSKFRVCSFSYQTWPTSPHFMCGMFGHSKYGHW